MEQIVPKSDNTIILKGLILTGALLLLISFGLPFLAVFKLSLGTHFFITRLAFWAWLAVIYTYVVKKERQPFLLWPEKAYSFGFYILSVIAIIFIILIASGTLALILKSLGLFKASNAIPLLRKLSIPVKILTIVTAGFVEELVFRGYLIPRLMKFFKNEHLPIIISSLVFGLMHYGFGTIINILVPTLIGLIFGYHYYKYRNLKVLITCHLLIDMYALFITLAKH
jgi:membrane protease YdiL (CAAX protease family)